MIQIASKMAEFSQLAEELPPWNSAAELAISNIRKFNATELHEQKYSHWMEFSL